MGEVYLALDTKLGRKLALKILPGELASNQDRMRRFTQDTYLYRNQQRGEQPLDVAIHGRHR
jgi:serine/threonine protein kinase